MPSLLLATETEVTATDFDSRTDLTDLETDAGEHLGGAGMGDEERREKMAAGMIQLAFRKHAVRRRKLRRKVAGSGLGSVEEVAEAKTKTKTPGEDDDSEDDEDVKKDVKKVVKKAEKAALKITSSIRSLKTNKNQPTEDPGLGKRGRRSGGRIARERHGVQGKTRRRATTPRARRGRDAANAERTGDRRRASSRGEAARASCGAHRGGAPARRHRRKCTTSSAEDDVQTTRSRG